MLMPAARSLKWWKKRPYWRLVESRVVGSAALCCATSDIEGSSLRALYGGAIRVIPNGVSDEPERLGLTRSEFRGKTVLFLGRIHPIKNLEALLEASNAMPAGWTMVIAGSGEASYAASLEAMGRRWGGERVQFVGEVTGRRKWELISSSSVLVLPSHSENFGNVVLEALAVGTPVIASRATPWAVLEDAGAGLWVDCTAQGLRAALVTLGTEPETWRHREEMARTLAQSFRWPLIAARVLECYREVMRRYEANAEA
jgi:glycosyltransferase involved in cell wall biosynthesis